MVAYWERPLGGPPGERNPAHIPTADGDLVRVPAFCGFRWTGNYGGKVYDVSRRGDRLDAKRNVCGACRKRWVARMTGAA